MRLIAIFLSALILAGAVPVGAQVNNPCATCAKVTQLVYPETGIWANPERNGTGFMLEVQGGVLAGGYFGYDRDGRALWYVLNGVLRERKEDPEVIWTFESELLGFSGGSCIDCGGFLPPFAQPSAGRIQIDFLARSVARYRIDGGTWTILWPTIYGSEASARFAGITGMRVADLRGPWQFSFKEFHSSFDPADPINTAFRYDSLRYSYRVSIQPWSFEEATRTLRANVVFNPALPSSAIPAGELVCQPNAAVDGIGCAVTLYYGRRGQRLADSAYKRFAFPLGNVSDSRFKGQTEDEESLEAFRLGYD